MRTLKLLLGLALFLPSFASAGTPLYTYWYTVSSAGQPFQYYSEKAELRDKRVWLLNQIWKKDGDFINEEQLGVVAENITEPQPVLFNFRSVYRGQVSQIDGTFNDGGRKLSVKIRKADQDQPALNRSIPPGTLPSTLFPFWLSKRLPKLRVGQTATLKVVMEDNVELEFRPLATSVRREKDDDYAVKTKTSKLRVKTEGSESLWWVDAKGAALRIENPTQKLIVERVSEKVARKYLD